VSVRITTNELRDDVIVTGLVPYGDSDVVVRFFARDHGRAGAFARKARASRKRFAALSAPCTGQARFKPSKTDLFELLELDVHPRVLSLAQDLRCLGHASYVCELIERMLPEGEPAPEVFALVDATLATICTTGTSARLLRALELKLLLHAGYLPDLTHATEVSELDDEARGAAHALVSAELGALPDVEDAVLRRVSRLFAGHLRRQGGAPLKSVQFLQSLA
jgi:DNA repair protein RecO